MSPQCPTWLTRAIQSEAYMREVLGVLNEREIQRERARAASRHPRRGHLSRVVPSPYTLPPSPALAQAYSVSVGFKPENQPANRYIYFEPLDRTRVVVGERADAPGEGRYLNASWVRERFGGKWWIAAQAPLPNTTHAFLSVLLQPNTQPPTSLCAQTSDWSAPAHCRVRTVVQLTLSHEHGRTKAHPYFPTKVGQGYVIPPEAGCTVEPLEVTLLESQSIQEARCILSTLQLVRRGSEPGSAVKFRHMLYTAWPDHGVPEPQDRSSLLAFVRLVARMNRDTSILTSDVPVHPDPPMIVGCSAGIGRTGAFITISSLLRAHGLLLAGESGVSRERLPTLPESPLGRLPAALTVDDVAQEIDSLREQRSSMVQRDEQALLVYELLYDAFRAS